MLATAFTRRFGVDLPLIQAEERLRELAAHLG